MFLGKCGKNKIRLGNREESTVRLRAFSDPHPSRSHRNLGLLNLVPRPLGIVLRLQKTRKTLLLISLQNVNAEDKKYSFYGYSGEHTHHQPLPPLHSA